MITVRSRKYGRNLAGLYESNAKALPGRMRNGRDAGVDLMYQSVRNVIFASSPSGVVTSTGERRSAPGQPPAIQSGTLINSLVTEKEEFGGDAIGRVVATAPYASMLEFGTVHMKPRPFMRVGAFVASRDMSSVVARAMRR